MSGLVAVVWPEHDAKTMRAIFEEALVIGDAGERRAFVGRSCEGNEALRRDIEELLAASRDSRIWDATVTNL